MAIVVPDAAEIALLEMLVKDAAPNNLVLRLFTNNLTPSDSTVIGDFTEATFAGYAAKTLTRTSFGAASTAAGVTSIQYAQQNWQNTSGANVTVYGWYITEAVTGDLLMCERFASPVTIPNNDYLYITPRIELA